MAVASEIYSEGKKVQRVYMRGVLLWQDTPAPSVVNRYIEGYASNVNQVRITINGTASYANVNGDGRWRYDIPADLVITSLENFFSADIENSGYGPNNNISYIDLSHIGDTSRNTSLKKAFSSLVNMTGILIPQTFDTTAVRSINCIFEGCYSLLAVDMGMFDLASFPESASDLSGDFDTAGNDILYVNNDYGHSSLTKCYINYLPFRVNSSLFNGCDQIVDFYVNKIKYEFKLKDCPNLSTASVERIITALYDWNTNPEGTAVPNNRNLALHQAVTTAMTQAQRNAIAAKGWTLRNN